MSKTQTYWNGLPTPARRGTAVVADAPEFPAYWARDLAGERIAVVEVTLEGVARGGGITFLDDREGDGWAKVTEGHGGPGWGHANVYIEAGSFIEGGSSMSAEITQELSADEKAIVERFGLDKPEAGDDA